MRYLFCIAILFSCVSLEAATFQGKEVKTKRDVDAMVDQQTLQTFGGQKDQLKLLSEMVALLFAYQGVISFADVGIPGVTDKTSADTYVVSLYATFWQTRNTLLDSAKQCIQAIVRCGKGVPRTYLIYL